MQEGWSVTSLAPVGQPDHAAIQDADIVLVGTWVHGLFVVGQTPWAAAKISNLPAMRGKRAAVFCTFALNPGKSLDRLTGAVQATGAEVVGGLALHRSKLEAHSEEFCPRLARRRCAASSSEDDDLGADGRPVPQPGGVCGDWRTHSGQWQPDLLRDWSGTPFRLAFLWNPMRPPSGPYAKRTMYRQRTPGLFTEFVNSDREYT